MDNFGMRLKEVREQSKLTQEELAEKIGISRSRIAQYESNKGYPKADILFKLCSFLNVSSDWLMGIPDKKIEEQQAT